MISSCDVRVSDNRHRVVNRQHFHGNQQHGRNDRQPSDAGEAKRRCECGAISISRTPSRPVEILLNRKCLGAVSTRLSYRPSRAVTPSVTRSCPVIFSHAMASREIRALTHFPPFVRRHRCGRYAFTKSSTLLQMKEQGR